LIEGADHGLSSEPMQGAYTQILTKWFTEIVFCQKPAEEAPLLAVPSSGPETAPAAA
jgi:hypothetical protein